MMADAEESSSARKNLESLYEKQKHHPGKRWFVEILFIVHTTAVDAVSIW
jgi:hypothetical protein